MNEKCKIKKEDVVVGYWYWVLFRPGHFRRGKCLGVGSFGTGGEVFVMRKRFRFRPVPIIYPQVCCRVAPPLRVRMWRCFRELIKKLFHR